MCCAVDNTLFPSDRHICLSMDHQCLAAVCDVNTHSRKDGGKVQVVVKRMCVCMFVCVGNGRGSVERECVCMNVHEKEGERNKEEMGL